MSFNELMDLGDTHPSDDDLLNAMGGLGDVGGVAEAMILRNLVTMRQAQFVARLVGIYAAGPAGDVGERTIHHVQRVLEGWTDVLGTSLSFHKERKKVIFLVLDALWAHAPQRVQTQVAHRMVTNGCMPWLTHRLDWLTKDPLACAYVCKVILGQVGVGASTRAVLLGVLPHCSVDHINERILDLLLRQHKRGGTAAIVRQAIDVLVDTFDADHDRQGGVLWSMVNSFPKGCTAEQLRRAAERSGHHKHPEHTHWSSICDLAGEKPLLASVVMPYAPVVSVAQTLREGGSFAHMERSWAETILGSMTPERRRELWPLIAHTATKWPFMAAWRDREAITEAMGPTSQRQRKNHKM